MNWLKILVGLSAIIIAGCAAYFSVTGLGVLFAGASVSVMVMASSLELAKLVAATYLKQKWDEIGGFNKWYLTISVAVLMLITSAGIFGYLSNAFQAQSLQLQQVDREIAVHQTKIDQNTAQITQLSTQITEFNTNQGKIIDGGKVNSRLLRSIDNRDKEIAKINNKISDLQTQNAGETEKINEIKIKNLDLEKEVGGFRFVAEAFGVELKNVVKFFIFLIVIVFDPLAVALIIAFNGLIETKKQKRERILGEMMKNDQKLGLYEVYGDTKEDIVENISQNIGDSGKNSPIEEETPILEENIPNLQWEEFMHPDFPWAKKQLWINNPKAVQYWISTKRGTEKDYSKMLNEEENTKTY
jgi:cell division protein FtsL